VNVERHWREYVISEVLDALSEEANFFVGDLQKHLASHLHPALRKLELLLASQVRLFIDSSIADFEETIHAFIPDKGRSLPPSLLRLQLTTDEEGKKVVLDPSPAELIARTEEMMDGVVSVATTLYGIEHELVPFCGLGRKRMYEVDETYDLLVDAKHRVAAVLKKCLEGPQALLEEYEGYSFLLTETLPEDLDAEDVGRMEELVKKYLDAANAVERDVSATIVQYPLFELTCYSIIDVLSSCARTLANSILEMMVQKVNDLANENWDTWEATHNRVLSHPSNEVELKDLKDFMSSIASVTNPLQEQTRQIHLMIGVLSRFNVSPTQEIIEKAFRSFSWPLQIRVDVFDATRSLDNQKVQFMAKLDQEKLDFARDMQKYEDDLAFIKRLDDYQQAGKYAVRITGLKDNLEKAKDRLNSFQERENLFNIEVSESGQLTEMDETFLPYAKLWTSAFDWKDLEEQWVTGPLNKQNSDDIHAQVAWHFLL
jgi:dynein heavy chain